MHTNTTGGAHDRPMDPIQAAQEVVAQQVAEAYEKGRRHGIVMGLQMSADTVGALRNATAAQLAMVLPADDPRRVSTLQGMDGAREAIQAGIAQVQAGGAS